MIFKGPCQPKPLFISVKPISVYVGLCLLWFKPPNNLCGDNMGTKESPLQTTILLALFQHSGQLGGCRLQNQNR